MPGVEADVLALRKRVETLERREKATGKLLAMLVKIFEDTHGTGRPGGMYPGHRGALGRMLEEFENTRLGEVPPEY